MKKETASKLAKWMIRNRLNLFMSSAFLKMGIVAWYVRNDFNLLYFTILCIFILIYEVVSSEIIFRIWAKMFKFIQKRRNRK